MLDFCCARLARKWQHPTPVPLGCPGALTRAGMPHELNESNRSWLLPAIAHSEIQAPEFVSWIQTAWPPAPPSLPPTPSTTSHPRRPIDSVYQSACET